MYKVMFATRDWLASQKKAEHPVKRATRLVILNPLATRLSYQDPWLSVPASQQVWLCLGL